MGDDDDGGGDDYGRIVLALVWFVCFCHVVISVPQKNIGFLEIA